MVRGVTLFAELLVRDPVPSFAKAAAERVAPVLAGAAVGVVLFVVMGLVARWMARAGGVGGDAGAGERGVATTRAPATAGGATGRGTGAPRSADGLPRDVAAGVGAGLLAVAAAAYVGLSLTGW